MSDLCGSCHREIGEKRISASLAIKWGDGRPDWQGDKGDFCSFGCLSDWARSKSDQHETERPSPEADPEPIVDRQTETLIR